MELERKCVTMSVRIIGVKNHNMVEGGMGSKYYLLCITVIIFPHQTIAFIKDGLGLQWKRRVRKSVVRTLKSVVSFFHRFLITEATMKCDLEFLYSIHRVNDDGSTRKTFF